MIDYRHPAILEYLEMLPGDDTPTRVQRAVQLGRALAGEFTEGALQFAGTDGDKEPRIVELNDGHVQVTRAILFEEPGQDRIETIALGKMTDARVRYARIADADMVDGYITEVVIEHDHLPGEKVVAHFGRNVSEADEILKAALTLLSRG